MARYLLRAQRDRAATDLGLQVRERVKEKGDAIILDFSQVPFIDVSAARAVETIICDGRAAGRMVYVTGMNKEVRSIITGLNADHCLAADTHFDKRIDALRAAVENWKRQRPNGGGSAPADTSGKDAVPQPS